MMIKKFFPATQRPGILLVLSVENAFPNPFSVLYRDPYGSHVLAFGKPVGRSFTSFKFDGFCAFAV